MKLHKTKNGNYKMVVEFKNSEDLAKILAEKFSKDALSNLRVYLGREAAKKEVSK